MPRTYIFKKTLLGWIICGSVNDQTEASLTRCNFANLIQNFKRFWEIEDVGTTETHYSSTEVACEEHFRQHTARTSDGGYIVALPFTQRRNELGSSRQQAIPRLLLLEKQFKLNPELQREYIKVMEEYLELGHMKETIDESESGFYSPHHAVIKETSLTTKVRVAKSSTTISLNDILLTGPTLQDDIFTLALRFRLHNFIFTGDIEKMYRQVLIRPEDGEYQRIVWQRDGKIKTYELQTVTFGLASAPYLAVRTLQQLAEDEKENYPLASKILRRDLYVDDVLTGTNSIEETTHLRNELINLLKAGGFNVRQCASNSPMVLQGLPDCAVNLQLLGGNDPTLKMLGVRWDSHNDSIVYTVTPIATRTRITMRTIASDIARIFDPKGLLNPVVAHAKIIQQQLWRLKLSWADSTPLETHTGWNEFASQLSLLNNLRFDRRVLQETTQKIELHGLCNAREKARGPCIYLRSEGIDGMIQVNLYCAKLRVTSLNGTYTIPRLELCAAELFSRLCVLVKEVMQIQVKREVFWSHSTIVLHWIKTSPHLLQRFVGNRVGKIQEKTNPETRKHGPSWLSKPEKYWQRLKIKETIEIPETKRAICLQTTPIDNSLLTRYSSFEQLKRITARCLRWKTKFTEKYLTAEELKTSEGKLIKMLHRVCFQADIAQLEAQNFSTCSQLNNLSPFFDEENIIRVGGRLQK